MITHIGLLLREERERQKKTIEDVEKATHIRAKNLHAIEAEDWNAFPSRTYIQGVIKKYGAYLELDEEKLIAYFRRDYERRENLKFKNKADTQDFTPQNKRILRIVIAGITFAFLAFFGLQLYQYFKPPILTILEPTETTFKRVDKITIKGEASPESLIKVNGNEVFLDENNQFEAPIPLTEPKNKVIIEATGANGRITKIQEEYTKQE